MAKRQLQSFIYQNTRITFDFGDGFQMVNATEMAKPFKKPVGNFLRLKETKAFIELLEKRYSDVNIDRQVIRIVKGGDASEGLQGTWMDEKLALKFAAWLSQEFELWVQDRIYELLQTGKTELPSHQSMGLIARTLRLIASQLEEQDQINQEVKLQLLETSDRIDELEAKIATSDDEHYTIKGFCSLHKIQCPLDKAKTWGAMAKKLSNKKGYSYYPVNDERYGQVGCYHRDILNEVFAELI